MSENLEQYVLKEHKQKRSLLSQVDPIDLERRRSRGILISSITSALGNLLDRRSPDKLDYHRKSDSSIEKRSSSFSRRGSEDLTFNDNSSVSSLRIYSVRSNEYVDEFDVPSKDVHIKIPHLFIEDGLSMLKVSQKSKKRIFFQIDPQTLTFIWKVANKVGSTAIQKLVTHTKLKMFSIDDLKKVWYQQEARHFRDELNISREFENQWLTLSYYDSSKKKMKTLHLIADTSHDAKIFYNTINGLKKLRAELSEKFYLDLDNMDDDKKELVVNTKSPKKAREYLSFEDIVKYIQRLNINISEAHLRDIFDGMGYQKRVNDVLVIDFEEFKQFIATLKKRNDIESLWTDLCKTGEMDFDMFNLFVHEIQEEDFDPATRIKIFNKFSAGDVWTSESFNQFLLSKYSKPIEQVNPQEDYYDQPLNEYFISSSHNTYLMGKQIADLSSSEGYVRALQKGCRCVELDIWDGDDPVTGESIPIVCHGRAFTSQILLLNVLTTIKRYAFVATEYPLILSLEINCSYECQMMVIDLFHSILRDLVITEPMKGVVSLPSPNQLRNRILIKAKQTNMTNTVINESGMLISTSTSLSSSTSFSEDNSDISLPTREMKKKKNKKVIDQLSDLAIYIKGQKFRNFSLPESKTFNHCFSLSERTIDSMLNNEDQRKAIDKHNRKFMMRVYPSNMRLKSSNFDPIKYWYHGVQMVATNWQTFDLGQQINEALFDGDNKSGYYLKPKDIRKPLFKHTMRKNLHFESKTIKFNFTVISAHQLPKPKNKDSSGINPFIKYEIIGALDVKFTSNCTSQTSIISDNGFNPIWNETFSGTMVGNELLFVKFSLYTVIKDDEILLGVFVARLENLKQGYRYLPLNDIMGEELIYSSLFVKLNYEII